MAVLLSVLPGEVCSRIIDFIFPSVDGYMKSSDAKALLDIREALSARDLDSFRKAADARIDTLYAHETEIPLYIWHRFCCSIRIVLYVTRDSFSSILPTPSFSSILRSMPHRVQSLGIRRSFRSLSLTIDGCAQLAYAAMESQAPRPGSMGGNLRDVEFSSGVMSTSTADTLLRSLHLLRSAKLSVYIEPGRRWKPTAPTGLGIFDLSVSTWQASGAAPAAGEDAVLDLSQLCTHAHNLQDISLTSNSMSVEIVNMQELAQQARDCLKRFACPGHASSLIQADVWQLLQSLPQLEHAAVGELAISITPDSCVLQHLTQLRADITSVEVAEGVAARGSLARLLPGLLVLSVDELTSALLHVLHGSTVQALEGSISSAWEDEEWLWEGQEGLQGLAQALPQLRSINITELEDSEGVARDLLQAASGCEQLQELVVGCSCDVRFDISCWKALVAGRCRKLRRVVLCSSEVSMSGLLLLAGSKAELPELESVAARAGALFGDDDDWSDLEWAAGEQHIDGSLPVAAVESYMCGDAVLEAFLGCVDEEEQWEASKEAAARCQQQAAQVMGWWRMELGQRLGLIKSFALRQQLKYIACVRYGWHRFTGSQGRCEVSLTVGQHLG